MKELLVFGFFVTTALSANATPEQEALQNASVAFYKQSGLEAAVQYQIDHKVSDDVKKVTGNVFFIAKVIKERQISYGWTF